MWRWTMRIFGVLGAFLIVAALSGATYQWLATRKELAATPPPGQLVDIGGHRLHLWCTGNGAPAVILDTGLGGTAADWGFVQPDVARFTRVCSYDRAGMGYSDPGPSPRTARRIASELAELLDRGGIDGPVVLAGASIAGFDVRVFASDHPERAAGLVLVDASHEDQAHEVPQLARFVPLLSTIGALRLFGVSFGPSIESLAPSVRPYARATSFRAAGYGAAADEITHVQQSASEVRSSRRKLTIPVVVITGGRGAAGHWRELQRDQASLSERGCLMIAQESGHLVSIDQPEVVVNAIRSVVETARGHAVPLCAAPAGVERRRPGHTPRLLLVDGLPKHQLPASQDAQGQPRVTPAPDRLHARRSGKMGTSASPSRHSRFSEPQGAALLERGEVGIRLNEIEQDRESFLVRADRNGYSGALHLHRRMAVVERNQDGLGVFVSDLEQDA
jgi:pimeloyl-ACP methyl ester carboxylesterase